MKIELSPKDAAPTDLTDLTALTVLTDLNSP